MFCGKCGNQLAPGVRICSRCGHDITQDLLPSNIENINKNINSNLNTNVQSNNFQMSSVASVNSAIGNNFQSNVDNVNKNSSSEYFSFNDDVSSSNSITPNINNSNASSYIINNSINANVYTNNSSLNSNNNHNVSSTNVVTNDNNKRPVRKVVKRKRSPLNDFFYRNSEMITFGAILGCIICALTFLVVSVTGGFDNKYFFKSSDSGNNFNIFNNKENKNIQYHKYSTSIIYDNTYSGVSISNRNDAINLISKDSNEQKTNCPSDIRSVENDFINVYGITAVNLCEMDVSFAKELGNVFKKIYNDYPAARGYLTNLTLVNASMNEGYIAAFQPFFKFADSNTPTSLPWVFKSQILLNTEYFLNQDYLKATAKESSSTGHFPKNSTMYSPVAHEMGHYLSFLALMKYYKTSSILILNESGLDNFESIFDAFDSGSYSKVILKDAYNKYLKEKKKNVDFDTWRGTISNYALAQDNSGNYIYDETIAEAFHDVYLNGDKAVDASKYIVQVLKSKLGG